MYKLIAYRQFHHFEQDLGEGVLLLGNTMVVAASLYKDDKEIKFVKNKWFDKDKECTIKVITENNPEHIFEHMCCDSLMSECEKPPLIIQCK